MLNNFNSEEMYISHSTKSIPLSNYDNCNDAISNPLEGIEVGIITIDNEFTIPIDPGKNDDSSFFL